MRERPILMLSVLFLLGLLYADGGRLMFPAFAILLLLYSEPWKEKGLRRLCFSVGLVLAFGINLAASAVTKYYQKKNAI